MAPYRGAWRAPRSRGKPKGGGIRYPRETTVSRTYNRNEENEQEQEKWSTKFYQTLIGVWNCWSISNERFNYCDDLKYDILGLTELHNNQAIEQYQGRRWACSAHAETDEQGKSSDPAAGVTIMLSPRMAEKVIGEGHVGTRIAWVRIAGTVCNIFYVYTQ